VYAIPYSFYDSTTGEPDLVTLAGVFALAMFSINDLFKPTEEPGGDLHVFGAVRKVQQALRYRYHIRFTVTSIASLSRKVFC
jgi:hypothetical protein